MEASGLAPQDREVQALEGTEIVNGLECKLSTATSKVSIHCHVEENLRQVTCQAVQIRSRSVLQIDLHAC